MPRPFASVVVLTPELRDTLDSLVRARSTPQALVFRCRLILHAARPDQPTNQQVADEGFLSVDAVKMHLRTLFAKFELSQLPQNQKRAKLAENALQFGVISHRDIA